MGPNLLDVVGLETGRTPLITVRQSVNSTPYEMRTYARAQSATQKSRKGEKRKIGHDFNWESLGRRRERKIGASVQRDEYSKGPWAVGDDETVYDQGAKAGHAKARGRS